MIKVLNEKKLFEIKSIFEDHLNAFIKDNYSSDDKLHQACAYSLETGGKRIRPLIVYLVQDALGKTEYNAFSALSVELFHTASLIADDMPCMDNDAYRRGQPASHIKFGETVALLASYALITKAFECIFEASNSFCRSEDSEKEMRGNLALKNAAHLAGIKGATGGQFLDLFPNEEKKKRGYFEVVEKKTITLFQVAFLFGWIFGGGNLDRLDQVKKLGYHFGLVFQIADDVHDLDQDTAKANRPNALTTLGKEQAKEVLSEHFSLLQKELEKLGLQSMLFDQLLKKIKEYSEKKT